MSSLLSPAFETKESLEQSKNVNRLVCVEMLEE